MYARKYYLIIYRSKSSAWIYIEKQIFYLNIQEAVINNIQESIINPSSFYEKSLLTFWLFDLLTFWPFLHFTSTLTRSTDSPNSPFTSFTQFTSFIIHLVQYSPFHFHIFTFSSPLPLPFPTYLPLLPFLFTSQHPGQRLKKSGTTLSFLAKMY